MIEGKQPTKALTANDITCVPERRGIGVDELVADALMWTLTIEVGNVGIQGAIERSDAKKTPGDGASRIVLIARIVPRGDCSSENATRFSAAFLMNRAWG